MTAGTEDTPRVRHGRIGAALWAASDGKATRSHWRMLIAEGLAVRFNDGRTVLTLAGHDVLGAWRRANRAASAAP